MPGKHKSGGFFMGAPPAQDQSGAGLVATYYVDKTNGSSSDSNPGTALLPWLTVAKAAATMVAGNSVAVVAGVYDEQVTPTNSGSAGSPITYLGDLTASVRSFDLSSKNYIVINSLNLTQTGMTTTNERAVLMNGSTHCQVISCNVHHTNREAVYATTACTSCRIASNTFAHVGSTGSSGIEDIIAMIGTENLIEGNDMSFSGDYVHTFGARNVVRNNRWHDSDPGATGQHIDGWQSGYALGSVANYTLLEGNYHYNNAFPDSHFGLINDTNPGSSTTIIVRHNLCVDSGNGFYTSDASANTADHHKVYNNTVVRPSEASITNIASNLTGTDIASVRNNIFVDFYTGAGYPEAYLLKTSSGSEGDYNLAFDTGGTLTFGSSIGIGIESHSVLNQDPLFVSSSDFHLQGGSPALNAGGPLTTVAVADTGSGTSLVVTDAHFFQDGWAGVDPDWIAVGTVSNTVAITSINYGTNTITLASGITRSDGDAVSLYKKSDGVVVLTGSAPYIGALGT